MGEGDDSALSTRRAIETKRTKTKTKTKRETMSRSTMEGRGEKGLLWKLPEVKSKDLGKLGPGFGFGAGCGVGFGIGLFGGEFFLAF